MADTIQLWENERNRVRCHEACLFDDFNSPEMFAKTCKYAHQIGVWLWQDDNKRRLVRKATPPPPPTTYNIAVYLYTWIIRAYLRVLVQEGI